MQKPGETKVRKSFQNKSRTAPLADKCFHEPLPPDVTCLQSEAIGLLYSLHSLPAQMKAGVMALETPPGANENAEYYFTPDGLTIRLQVPDTFEGLHTTLRALLAVGQHSGCRLSDEIRAGYFELLGALIPSPTDVSALMNGEGLKILP